ncbi:hypothetical protein BD410DRAFT_786402 [Rickenella mellea]|uniref:Uncharacterized protein n=1 Tax=Rickenella mellea TaxID=50990 RepID=A0A4Y7Q9E8_9AGAM|nr:hypothetical protein BD410DRAFT_786402 [Rickenella mellea]
MAEDKANGPTPARMIAELVGVVAAWNAQIMKHHESQRDELQRLLNKVVKLTEDVNVRDRVRSRAKSTGDAGVMSFDGRLILVEVCGQLNDIERELVTHKKQLQHAQMRYEDTERRLGDAMEEIASLKEQLLEAKAAAHPSTIEAPATAALEQTAEPAPSVQSDVAKPVTTIAGSAEEKRPEQDDDVQTDSAESGQGSDTDPGTIRPIERAAEPASEPAPVTAAVEATASALEPSSKQRRDSKCSTSTVIPASKPGLASTQDTKPKAAAPVAPSDLQEYPDAMLVMGWRHTIQNAFLGNRKSADEEMPHYDALFSVVEHFDMKLEHLQFSKIGKVMRYIAILDQEHIPARDEEFRFRARAQALVKKWTPLLDSLKTQTRSV